VNPVRAIFLLAIRLYRVTVSPLQTFLFGPTCGCRFSPTCSQYAMEALSTHGTVKGIWLTLKRLARCHPWGGCGHDPVPQKSASATGAAPGSLSLADRVITAASR
jgi:putative membrane protein insertion efficiency factor